MRPAVPDDAGAVLALLTELGYPDNDEQGVRARLERWAAEPCAAVLVAEQSGVVVGVVSFASVPFLEREGRWARVVAIVTSHAVRGQGAGRLLMACAENMARELGCVQMEVTSANRRTDAHAFYAGLGYENWADRAGRFLKDLVPGFSAGSYAARFPAE